MKITRSLPFLLIAACTGGNDEPQSTDIALVTVATTHTIPSNGQCTHITATRLSDFAVSEYRGLLSGASFAVRTGDNHITATAYPFPCNAEPAAPPWIADDQIATIHAGANVITLSFHENVSVSVVPVFDANPKPIVEHVAVRTGRNGEDSAGPNYSLDGWEIKQITLPPAAPSETVLFTTEGTPVPYTPRGLATTHDGRFVVQVGEIDQPLWVFDAGGNLVDTLPVVYAPDQIHWSNTDGLDAAGLDAAGNDRFVRTYWIAATAEAGIEVLEQRTDAAGNRSLVVTQQIAMPADLAGEYAVGVTFVNGRYAVSTLPDSVSSHLVLVDAGGNLVAGPVTAEGDVEGLFDDGAGRLVAMNYAGLVTGYDDANLAVRPGTSAFPNGAGFGTPSLIAWRSRPGSEGFIVLNLTPALAYADPVFSTTSPLPIDLNAVPTVSGIDYRPDGDQLVLIERIPPAGQPTVRFYDLTTNLEASNLPLQGLPLPLRPRTIAYLAGSHQLVTHYRRPGGAPDAIDSVVFVHDAGGNLVTQFDLRAFGFTVVTAVNALPSGEIITQAIDITGKSRLVVTDAAGTPHRAYTFDDLPVISDLAPMTSGPFAGDVGAVVNQPSQYLRLTLP